MILFPDAPGPWVDGALCAQVGGDLWVSDIGENYDAARRVCAACPVRAECAEYALARPDLLGMWGGLSTRERKRIRAERGAA